MIIFICYSLLPRARKPPHEMTRSLTLSLAPVPEVGLGPAQPSARPTSLNLDTKLASTGLKRLPRPG